MASALIILAELSRVVLLSDTCNRFFSFSIIPPPPQIKKMISYIECHFVRFTVTADDIIMKTEAEKVNGDEEDEKRVRAMTLTIVIFYRCCF